MESAFSLNVPLRDFCTYHIGGPARYYFEPADSEALQSAVLWTCRTGVPLFILGKGSNVLVADSGFNGLVINTSKHLNETWISSEEATAECGADLSVFIEDCCSEGFGGLENLFDIPGTVGGGVYMNAGAFGSVISDTLLTVTSMAGSGEIILREKKEIEFGYRFSSYRKSKEIILKASFKLKPGDPSELSAHCADIKKQRDGKQPSGTWNCGSVFKRPEGNYAGTLIEKSGLKGHRVGGAVVSVKHANFILNEGGATAADVRKLISHIQHTVQEKSGILLEPEVVFLGDF